MLLEKEQRYLPSRNEIARRAAEVRARWSDATFYKRAGMTPPPVELLIIRQEDLGLRGRQQEMS